MYMYIFFNQVSSTFNIFSFLKKKTPIVILNVPSKITVKIFHPIHCVLHGVHVLVLCPVRVKCGFFFRWYPIFVL